MKHYKYLESTYKLCTLNLFKKVNIYQNDDV